LTTSFLAAHAGSQTLDSLCQDVFFALKRQCSELFPDLRDGINGTIRDYVTTNQELLSAGYEQGLESKTPSARTYTREQCISMAAAIPKQPMKEVLGRVAQERQNGMRKRGELERSQ
jgi:hypothetical protein